MEIYRAHRLADTCAQAAERAYQWELLARYRHEASVLAQSLADDVRALRPWQRAYLIDAISREES